MWRPLLGRWSAHRLGEMRIRLRRNTFAAATMSESEIVGVLRPPPATRLSLIAAVAAHRHRGSPIAGPLFRQLNVHLFASAFYDSLINGRPD